MEKEIGSRVVMAANWFCLPAFESVRQGFFDHDRFTQLRTDAQPGITDLADKVAIRTQQFHRLFLVKAHFPQPLFDLGGGRQMFDANDSAGPHLA